MIDDLKYIHEKDAQDALGIAEKQWQQYQQDHGFTWQPDREIKSLVIAGMGGSGLAAIAAKNWLGLSIPYEVVHDYELPKFVDRNTLVICSSYSGNTEETLSCLEQALTSSSEDAKPMVIIVASGGKMLEIAKYKNLPFITLPGGFQPRMTFGYQLRALCEIFEQARLCSGTVDQLNQTSTWLKNEIVTWIPTNSVKSNQAKQLALECIGKSPVIYAGPKLFPAAYKWKISFNENAKNVAWYGEFPEFNHNEFLGWSSHPIKKPYTVIDLRSNLEHPQIQKRFEVTEKLLSGKRPAPLVIQVRGETLAQQLLWTIALGDFVSIYTALLNGLNPTPVELVEKFKREII